MPPRSCYQLIISLFISLTGVLTPGLRHTMEDSYDLGLWGFHLLAAS